MIGKAGDNYDLSLCPSERSEERYIFAETHVHEFEFGVPTIAVYEQKFPRRV